jgi:quinol monooxygenase YgiN
MLVISVRIRLDPSQRDAAIAAAKAVMAETHKEPGCNEYVFTADLDDPAVFRVFEEWESEDALGAHFTSPHMAEFQAAMGGFGISEMDAHKYTVTDKGPIR